MPHQLELWGKFSPQIEDYTRRGLQQKLTTEQGRKLSAMVDPYTYRDRLKMPKLIINGTNDAYWTLDALNLYWDDLAGEKLVLYVPNAGHGLNDALRVLNTVVNFARLVAADRPRPQMTWRPEQSEGKLTLTISSQPRPVAASLWVAHSDDRHFDQAKWVATDMIAKGDDFVGETARPEQGFLAAFGEATYEIDGRRFTLSTQMSLVGPKGQ
jgi:PhoPQ-activated pathogenicity-related protein